MSRAGRQRPLTPLIQRRRLTKPATRTVAAIGKASGTGKARATSARQKIAAAVGKATVSDRRSSS